MKSLMMATIVALGITAGLTAAAEAHPYFDPWVHIAQDGS